MLLYSTGKETISRSPGKGVAAWDFVSYTLVPYMSLGFWAVGLFAFRVRGISRRVTRLNEVNIRVCTMLNPRKVAVLGHGSL